MGKVSTIIIVFGLLIGAYAIFEFISSGEILFDEDLKLLSEQELQQMSMDWAYRDVVRNIDAYKGEVIFISGVVVNTQPDIDLITICSNSSTRNLDCEHMFIDLNENFNYLEDDVIRGCVQINHLSETVGRTVLGTEMGTSWLPRVYEIKLECIHC